MKIALVGAEPASQDLAPWDDLSWEIWTCALSGPTKPRSDIHFEIHNLPFALRNEPKGKLYIQHLSEHPHVLLARPFELLPNAKLLDEKPLVEKFSSYFLTSTPAIMMAEAIHRGAKEIGLFGLDMTANVERMTQRPGLQFFIREADRLGLKVVTPLESDILVPPPIYGFCEFDNFFRKQSVRRDMVAKELEQIKQKQQQFADAAHGAAASLVMLDYDLAVWGGAKCSDQ